MVKHGRPGAAHTVGTEVAKDYDVAIMIGQHAMAGVVDGDLSHTQSSRQIDYYKLNGKPIGEIAQFALWMGGLDIPLIFLSGDDAACREVKELIPGITTASVKRGTIPGRGDECTAEQYRARNKGAVHMHPERARKLIREGAVCALERLKSGEKLGIVPLTPPFRRVRVMRGKDERPQRTYDIAEHRTSVIELLNMPAKWEPVESDEQLKDLLVEEHP